MRVVVRAGPAAGTRSIASGPVAQWDDWWLRPFGGFTCPDTGRCQQSRAWSGLGTASPHCRATTREDATNPTDYLTRRPAHPLRSVPAPGAVRRWTGSPPLPRVRFVAGRQRQAVPLRAHRGDRNEGRRHGGAVSRPLAVPAPSDAGRARPFHVVYGRGSGWLAAAGGPVGPIHRVIQSCGRLRNGNNCSSRVGESKVSTMGGPGCYVRLTSVAGNHPRCSSPTPVDHCSIPASRASRARSPASSRRRPWPRWRWAWLP